MTPPHSESDPTHPRSCDSVCSLDLPSMARRCTALRASVPSSSLASLHSLPPSTSRSHRPRRPSRRGSVFTTVARSYAFEFDAAGRSFGGVPPKSHPPPHWRVAVLDPVPLCMHANPLTNRSFSDGAAEMAPKTVNGFSNALDGPGLFNIDAPNDDQCGLFDVGAHSDDQRKPFAPNDNQCAPDESVVASPEAFKPTEPVRIDFSRLCPEPLTLTPRYTLPESLEFHTSFQPDNLPPLISRPAQCLTTRPRASGAAPRSTRPDRSRVPSCAPQPPQTHPSTSYTRPTPTCHSHHDTG